MEAVEGAIKAQAVVSNILPESRGKLLRELVVNAFVPSDALRDIRLNGLPAKERPQNYFERQAIAMYGGHLETISSRSMKDRYDEAVDYLRVAYEFDLCFFELAVVIFIKPDRSDGAVFNLTPTPISEELGPISKMSASAGITSIRMLGEQGDVLCMLHASELLNVLR
ncbi:MAG: hypothetical protein U5O39_19900 [Gammaproteobacteria bacterium]|nr:hypothetical protein [Gammaproteobacteria bacterium]